jgi:hypothetical protein
MGLSGLYQLDGLPIIINNASIISYCKHIERLLEIPGNIIQNSNSTSMPSTYLNSVTVVLLYILDLSLEAPLLQ